MLWPLKSFFVHLKLHRNLLIWKWWHWRCAKIIGGVPSPPIYVEMCYPTSDASKASVSRLKSRQKLEIILTLLHRIGIPPPTVVPWRLALHIDRQSNRRVGVFYLGSRNLWWTKVHVRRLKVHFWIGDISHHFGEMGEKVRKSRNLVNLTTANFLGAQNFKTNFGYFFSGTVARKILDHAPWP